MKQETAAERQWKQNEHRDQDLARVKRSKEKDWYFGRENYWSCCVTWASELKIVAAVKEDQLRRKPLDHRSTENSHSSRSPWTNTKRRRLRAAKHERKIAARARDPGWQGSVHTNRGLGHRRTLLHRIQREHDFSVDENHKRAGPMLWPRAQGKNLTRTQNPRSQIKRA
jgi:hypothetical protein